MKLNTLYMDFTVHPTKVDGVQMWSIHGITFPQGKLVGMKCDVEEHILADCWDEAVARTIAKALKEEK